MFLLSARIKKIHSKLKALEWSQHFSHYKSMGIFPNAQGQVTHKSLVGSCWILNPRMKKIQSKMKALEWSQHYSLIFWRSREANSEVSNGILLKFNLIQAFIVALTHLHLSRLIFPNFGVLLAKALLTWLWSAQCSIWEKYFPGLSDKLHWDS